jgi:hypothetical protein
VRLKLAAIAVSRCHLTPVICGPEVSWRTSSRSRPSASISARTPYSADRSRQGRYNQIAGNMQAKEVRISDTDRFVICHNPEAAERDKHTREQLTAQLAELIGGPDELQHPARTARQARRPVPEQIVDLQPTAR